MEIKVQRDVLLERIYEKMITDEAIYFLSADFGSPVLDKLRESFGERFTNVGIAEQNLISIAAGLALEGYAVYAYAIAPFLTMRAYEQIRTSLSMLSQVREINVNLIGVGIGLSYDVTGPTHHCLEDLCIMRTLPNIVVFSPSDHVAAASFVDYTLAVKKPKYIRLDGKPLPRIHQKTPVVEDGFVVMKEGRDVCIVSTGYMTHKALSVAEELGGTGIDPAVIDLFLIKPFPGKTLSGELAKYRHVVTLEEGFIGKGGLGSAVQAALRDEGISIGLTELGFRDEYVFRVGDREYLHGLCGVGIDTIIETVKRISSEL